jgi:integrase
MGEQATDVQPKRKRRPRGSGSIYSVPGSRFLWICYYDAAGKQRRESSGSEKPTDAQNLLRRRMAEVQNGTFIEPKKRRVTVDELYQDELADLEKRRKQTRWVKPCWERLEKFFGGRQACLIRRADLEAYQTYRLQEYRKEFPDADEKKLSACETLINKDLAVLRMVLYRGHALEKLAAVPPFPPKLQGAMERAGTVTEEQFRVMLADCGNDEVWLKAMLLMSYTWGYRLEELLKMRCIQVSLTDRIVYLPPRSTKNKRPRPIPISDDEIGHCGFASAARCRKTKSSQGKTASRLRISGTVGISWSRPATRDTWKSTSAAKGYGFRPSSTIYVGRHPQTCSPAECHPRTSARL